MAEENPQSYDQILEKIGQFGTWQKKIIIFLWIPPILAGLGFMQYSFAVGTPSEYRCLVRSACFEMNLKVIVYSEQFFHQHL